MQLHPFLGIHMFVDHRAEVSRTGDIVVTVLHTYHIPHTLLKFDIAPKIPKKLPKKPSQWERIVFQPSIIQVPSYHVEGVYHCETPRSSAASCRARKQSATDGSAAHPISFSSVWKDQYATLHLPAAKQKWVTKGYLVQQIGRRCSL